MPLADAHIHIFGAGFAGPSGVSPAGDDELKTYEELRVRHGIERSLVIGYEGEPKYLGNNREILRLAQDRPWMAPLVYLHVSTPPSVRELRRYRAAGAVGFALYLRVESEGVAFTQWPTGSLAELCAPGTIISFNATPEALAPAIKSVTNLGNARVIFSHLGLPGRFDTAPSPKYVRERLYPLLHLASIPSVSVKLSGLYAISERYPHQAARPFVDAILESFGPSRLLWGSDYAPALDYASFAEISDSHLVDRCTPTEIQDVMGRNLLRILGEPSGSLR